MDWWVTACAVDMVVLRLRRDCPSAGPYVAWVGDLIDIRTDETRRQLAAVLDLHWRPVPGFASGVHHDAALATAALLHGRRGAPAATCRDDFHSDEGGAYTGEDLCQASENALAMPPHRTAMCTRTSDSAELILVLPHPDSTITR
jgi:hypothetical protein